MIRLGTEKKTPQRLPLPGGASILYRPVTSVDREAGLAAARRFFEELRRSSEGLENYGFPAEMDVNADATLAIGMAALVNLVEISSRVVMSWEGVGDADGAPLPVTRQNLAALLREPLCFNLLDQALSAPLYELADEGNGLAPSPNGAPAGAPPTAPAAARSEAHVPTAKETPMETAARSTESVP